MLPLTSRNTPPPIRTRSRIEIALPARVNNVAFIRASIASVSNSRMRVTQASARPKRRALDRRPAGSRLTEIEMNTRLSTPSTISSVASVIRATQTSLSNIHSKSSVLA